MTRLRLLTLLGFTFVLIVFIGAGIFHSTEDWTFGDSLYTSVITTTTVGYGDFVPTSGGGKATASILSIVGVIMFFVMIAVLGDFRFDKIDK